jgi:hypothetical protein
MLSAGSFLMCFLPDGGFSKFSRFHVSFFIDSPNDREGHSKRNKTCEFS